MFKKLQEYLLGKVGPLLAPLRIDPGMNESATILLVTVHQHNAYTLPAPVLHITQGRPQSPHASPPPSHPSKGTKRVLPTPLLLDTPHGSGGVQGLGWFLARLLVDEDGDVADGFIVEDEHKVCV